MVDYVEAALSGVGVLVVLGIGWFVYTRFFVPRDRQRTDEQTREELRMEDEDLSADERLGFFAKQRAQPGTTKLFYLSVVAFAAVVAVAGYTVLRSGSPSEVAYSKQITQFIYGSVIAGGMLIFVRRQDRKAGKLRVVIDDDGDQVTTNIPFDWEAADPGRAAEGSSGVVRAPAFKRKRLLGLLWLTKLAGEDPEARELRTVRPDDRVVYEIPTDNSAAWDHQNKTVTVRAKDITTLDNPDTRATHRLVPTERKSMGEIQDMQDTINELEEELKQKDRLLSVKDSNLEELEEMLENDSVDRDEVRQDALNELMSIMAHMNGAGHQTGAPGGPNGEVGESLREGNAASNGAAKNGATK